MWICLAAYSFPVGGFAQELADAVAVQQYARDDFVVLADHVLDLSMHRPHTRRSQMMVCSSHSAPWRLPGAASWLTKSGSISSGGAQARRVRRAYLAAA
jgi:hypothetical protein